MAEYEEWWTLEDSPAPRKNCAVNVSGRLAITGTKINISGPNHHQLAWIYYTEPLHFSDSEEQREKKEKKWQQMDKLTEDITKFVESQQMVMES